MAEIFGAAATKQLLLQLESENAALRLTEKRLTEEVGAVTRQLEERDRALGQLESVRILAQTPLPDRGEETAQTALLLERSRCTDLERRNARLQREVKTLEEQLRAQTRALSEAEAEAAEERAAREDTTRVADEAYEALREQETGARSAARSASKFAQSLVALESKVARHDALSPKPDPNPNPTLLRALSTLTRWSGTTGRWRRARASGWRSERACRARCARCRRSATRCARGRQPANGARPRRRSGCSCSTNRCAPTRPAACPPAAG